MFLSVLLSTISSAGTSDPMEAATVTSMSPGPNAIRISSGVDEYSPSLGPYLVSGGSIGLHCLREKLVDVVYLVWPKIDLEDWLVIDLHVCVAVGGYIR